MESKLVVLGAFLLDASSHKTGTAMFCTNFHVWLNIFDELFPFNPEFAPLQASWNKLSNRLRHLNDTRVRLAHNTRWANPEGISAPLALWPSGYDGRRKSKKYKGLTTAEIDRFSLEVLDVDERLSGLIEALEAARIAHIEAKFIDPNEYQE